MIFVISSLEGSAVKIAGLLVFFHSSGLSTMRRGGSKNAVRCSRFDIKNVFNATLLPHGKSNRESLHLIKKGVPQEETLAVPPDGHHEVMQHKGTSRHLPSRFPEKGFIASP